MLRFWEVIKKYKFIFSLKYTSPPKPSLSLKYIFIYSRFWSTSFLTLTELNLNHFQAFVRAAQVSSKCQNTAEPPANFSGELFRSSLVSGFYLASYLCLNRPFCFRTLYLNSLHLTSSSTRFSKREQKIRICSRYTRDISTSLIEWKQTNKYPWKYSTSWKEAFDLNERFKSTYL